MSADTRPADERIEIGVLFGAVLARWLRIVLVTAVALGVTFAILLFVPKMYESTASLLVEERAAVVTVTPGQSAPASPSIPVEAMMSSQIELIKSRDTLLSVIDSENLRSEPEFTGIGASPVSLVLQLLGRSSEPRSVDQTVLENLRDRLTVVQERDSAVISIRVRSQNPELAARIANAIAEAHVRRRAALSLSDTAEASAWLEQEIERLRVRVQEAEAAVANYRVDNDLFTGTDDTAILNQQLTAITTQITEAQQRKNAAQSRANLIRQLLAEGQPLDGVTDVRESVVIQQLSQTKATLQGELAQRSSTLLPNHPTIKALVAQIAEIEDQIAAEARRVASALEAEAQIEGDLEASLRDDLARTKISVSNATRDGVTLESLQREAAAQRDLLETYLLRYSDAVSRTEAGSALPDVRQVTIAAPASEPASPKTTLILAAVGFVVLALQVGGILFGELMSGRALTDRYAFREVHETDEDEAEEPVIRDLFDETGAKIEVREETEVVFAAEDEQRPRPIDFMAPAQVMPAAEENPAPEAPTDQPESAAEEAPLEAGGLAGVAAASVREEEIAPAPATPARHRPARNVDEKGLELGNLAADIAIGRVRVAMLAGLGDGGACEEVADALVADAMRHGLSVVRIDAASGRLSREPGITDLSSDLASFGDVVHRVREGLAEVPWGQQEALERRSMRPATLVEALTDIYEVVIVLTGRIGMASALPIFSGIPCRLVLVGEGRLDRLSLEMAIEDAANLGYDIGQIVYPPQRQPEVA